MIASIVGGTVLFVILNDNQRLEKWVNDRHYYSRWAKPFRWPWYSRINDKDPGWRGEFRMRRRLQRSRRRAGESIHTESVGSRNG